MWKPFSAGAAALLLAAAAPAFGQGAASQLPGGASSLQESHEDWQVSCAVRDARKSCSISQQQRQKDSNQLVLAIDLSSGPKDGATGALVLPFGLRLADGVTLQIDEGKPSPALAFSTCLPAGCIVPLSLDGAFLKALRSGTALKLAAKAEDGGKGVVLTISLKGFASAHDRLKALAGS